MTAKLRHTPAYVAQHIVIRGNNKQVIFKDDDDRIEFAKNLKKFNINQSIAIHAWVFMSNHVHLLLTPNSDTACSAFCHRLFLQHSKRFNAKYNRTGTLYEKRHWSAMVSHGDYLFALYRYIEMNPVRAGIVTRPIDYKWSSYKSNAHGIHSTIITPHPDYLALSQSTHERLRLYQESFENMRRNKKLQDQQLDNIRTATRNGTAIGDPEFVEHFFPVEATDQSLGITDEIPEGDWLEPA